MLRRRRSIEGVVFNVFHFEVIRGIRFSGGRRGILHINGPSSCRSGLRHIDFDRLKNSSRSIFTVFVQARIATFHTVQSRKRRKRPLRTRRRKRALASLGFAHSVREGSPSLLHLSGSIFFILNSILPLNLIQFHGGSKRRQFAGCPGERSVEPFQSCLKFGFSVAEIPAL